jgi:photosynthetic reaction center H subunit
MIRYIEVALAGGAHVLAPMPLAVFDKSRKSVKIEALLASQFAGAPALATPGQITFDEEERVAAYFGGGLLYATKSRSEPLI